MNEKLPTNPFAREPKTALRTLSGRSSEIAQLNYCYQLTANGQSNHCALIGPRGVGKSSLILSSKELASAQNLLVVNIDLNLDKVKTLTIFWKELYVSLCSTAAKYDCWGGKDGDEYEQVVRNLCGQNLRGPLQLPRFWNDGVCPDTVIKEDLATIFGALTEKGFQGILVCIDEADCLSIDVSLLQSLRNVFQATRAISLVLAGTAKIFSQIAEIFSPIPRQFHKIEVLAFPHWSEIQSLTNNALGGIAASVGPDINTIMDLYRITGGDPSEILLYCHEMYKEVELGNTDRMSLNHRVYGAVFQEFRKFTTDDARKIAERLEVLSTTYIPRRDWLRNASLDVEENTNLRIALIELDEGKQLALSEIEKIRSDVKASYEHLYYEGVTSDPRALVMNDAACIRGLWQSLVRLNSGDEWEWRDGSFYELLLFDIQKILTQKTGAVSVIFSSPIDVNSSEFDDDRIFEILACKPEQADDIAEAVKSVVSFAFVKQQTSQRLSKTKVATFHQTSETLFLLGEAFNKQKKSILRIPVTMEVGTLTATKFLTYFDSKDPNDELQQVRSFIEQRNGIFQQHNITICLGKPAMYKVPDFNHMRHLIAKLGILVEIQPREELEKGIKQFTEGNIKDATTTFEGLLRFANLPFTKNNLAFCYIHLGELEKAEALLEKLLKTNRKNLFVHNLAIVKYLKGDVNSAKAILEDEWANFSAWSDTALLMNVISERGLLEIWQDVPVAVGIVLTMQNLGVISKEESNSILTSNGINFDRSQIRVLSLQNHPKDDTTGDTVSTR